MIYLNDGLFEFSSDSAVRNTII